MYVFHRDHKRPKQKAVQLYRLKECFLFPNSGFCDVFFSLNVFLLQQKPVHLLIKMPSLPLIWSNIFQWTRPLLSALNFVLTLAETARSHVPFLWKTTWKSNGCILTADGAHWKSKGQRWASITSLFRVLTLTNWSAGRCGQQHVKPHNITC